MSNTKQAQGQRLRVVVSDGWRKGSNVDWAEDAAQARKLAAWYRGRGYKVRTITQEQYLSELNAH